MQEDSTALLPEANLHVTNARCSCELHGSKKVLENVVAIACENGPVHTHYCDMQCKYRAIAISGSAGKSILC